MAGNLLPLRKRKKEKEEKKNKEWLFKMHACLPTLLAINWATIRCNAG